MNPITMGALRRLLACLLLLALVSSGAALAGRGDPQEKLNPADQARAKAMSVRVSDLPGWKGTKLGPSDDDFYCKALDESALTITGEAESPDITLGLLFVYSQSQVYESRRDADISWRQGTSAAGMSCIREEFRREVSGPTTGSSRSDGSRSLAWPSAGSLSEAPPSRRVCPSRSMSSF